jgi:hypothetical protein
MPKAIARQVTGKSAEKSRLYQFRAGEILATGTMLVFGPEEGWLRKLNKRSSSHIRKNNGI